MVVVTYVCLICSCEKPHPLYQHKWVSVDSLPLPTPMSTPAYLRFHLPTKRFPFLVFSPRYRHHHGLNSTNFGCLPNTIFQILSRLFPPHTAPPNSRTMNHCAHTSVHLELSLQSPSPNSRTMNRCSHTSVHLELPLRSSPLNSRTMNHCTHASVHLGLFLQFPLPNSRMMNCCARTSPRAIPPIRPNADILFEALTPLLLKLSSQVNRVRTAQRRGPAASTVTA